MRLYSGCGWVSGTTNVNIITASALTQAGDVLVEKMASSKLHTSYSWLSL